MKNKKLIRILVLSGKIGTEMVNWLKNKTNFIFDTVESAYDCTIKLQAEQYDGLIVDTAHLMIGDKVNTCFIRIINLLAPVIVISDGEKPEIENEIRAEMIFYYLVNPTYDGELKQAIIQAVKWKTIMQEKENAVYRQKFMANVPKFFGICLLVLLTSGLCRKAGDISVPISAYGNLTGNTCSDRTGAGFANNSFEPAKAKQAGG